MFYDFFKEFDRLHREFEGAGFPAVNVYKNADEAVVVAEIPGVHPENIELSVKERRLTIEGKREAVEVGEDTQTLRSELARGEFRRTLRLPFDVKEDSIEAAAKDGVLTVRLPLAEAAKPRKIAVKKEAAS